MKTIPATLALLSPVIASAQVATPALATVAGTRQPLRNKDQRAGGLAPSIMNHGVGPLSKGGAG